MKIMPALVIAVTLSFATTTAFAADASVSGYFRAEGKEAKLGFARVAAAKTYGGDPTIAFAFYTEKDASDAKEAGVVTRSAVLAQILAARSR